MPTTIVCTEKHAFSYVLQVWRTFLECTIVRSFTLLHHMSVTVVFSCLLKVYMHSYAYIYMSNSWKKNMTQFIKLFWGSKWFNSYCMTNNMNYTNEFLQIELSLSSRSLSWYFKMLNIRKLSTYLLMTWTWLISNSIILTQNVWKS